VVEIRRSLLGVVHPALGVPLVELLRKPQPLLGEPPRFLMRTGVRRTIESHSGVFGTRGTGECVICTTGLAPRMRGTEARVICMERFAPQMRGIKRLALRMRRGEARVVGFAGRGALAHIMVDGVIAVPRQRCSRSQPGR
jgi:hypothetical protein